MRNECVRQILLLSVLVHYTFHIVSLNIFFASQGIDFLAFALSGKDLVLPKSITVTSAGPMHSCTFGSALEISLETQSGK